MKLVSKIWTIIEKPFLYVGTICSIASIVVICFVDNWTAWVALLFVLLSILVLLIAVLRVLNRYLEKGDEQDFDCISTFVNYKSDDGDNITFETYKLIQAKCSIMQYFDVGFKWSGKDMPKWTSDLQDVEFVNPSHEEGKYDSARLRFRTPVLYNQTTLIHFRSNINDVNHLSEPKVELCVKYPIEYIQIVVSLGYKDSSFTKPASVSKTRIISDMHSDYKNYDSVSFDPIHKQYVVRLIHPEPGYYYKITWER